MAQTGDRMRPAPNTPCWLFPLPTASHVSYSWLQKRLKQTFNKMSLHCSLPAQPEPVAFSPRSQLTLPAETMAPPRFRISSPSVTTAKGALPTTPHTSANGAKPPTTKPKLLSFNEIPGWYQDNEHIRHGYRPVSGSASTSFASWRYMHNESVNIYSHLVPCIAFFLGEWYVLQYLHTHYARVTVTHDLIFAFFVMTAVVCLGFSFTYHTLINHSHKLERIWLRLDLVGIVLLTLGDFVSGIYMVFWCEPTQRKIYWAMVRAPSLKSRHFVTVKM